MRELDSLEYLETSGIILDVRSPKEFEHSRIPGAVNLPLLNDEERVIIGTLYKQSGKAAAIEEGFALVGPKLKTFVKTAKELLKDKPAKIYCARGGLRSSIASFILKTADIPTFRLKNGYKAFRNFCLRKDFSSLTLIVIAGLSGSGKTEFLHNLKQNNLQTIDLEGLARHRGSSYGMLPGVLQISTEQFENEIFCQLLQFDESLPIYIEDESRMIGKCRIPDSLFQKMGTSLLFLIEKPFSIRVEKLFQDYGSLDTLNLIDATNRIAKRLGSLRTSQVIAHIESGFLKPAIEIVLKYYDSTYLEGIKQRSTQIKKIDCNDFINNNGIAHAHSSHNR